MQSRTELANHSLPSGMSASDERAPRPWRVERSEPGPHLKIFQVREDELTNPRNGITARVTVLETPDWVNVIPVTDDGLMILVEQWRFGPRRTTLEIPGGMIDPGEDPAAAAARELLEETGHGCRELLPLGHCEPNPAFHDNRCFHYLARGAHRVGDQQQDTGEDVRVVAVPIDEVLRMVADGRITHSLVLAALCRVMPLLGPDAPSLSGD